MATYGKKHQPESLTFDAFDSLAFPSVTLAASQANTTVQAAIPIPTNFKIFYIVALLTGSLAGTCSINVVAGTAGEAGVGTKDTALTNGQQVLSLDTALTMTANQTQRIQASVPDSYFSNATANASIATLRTVTNGSAAGTLLVWLLGKYEDPNPTKPLYNSSGALTF